MSSQRGFSLIEALIALLVLSIGLIGVAAMQLKALQSANAGYQRSVASVAAVDAQERLWAQLATLNPGETCEDIDASVVQAEWKDYWFQSSNANPLRGSSSSQSSIKNDGTSGGSDGCRINVNVALGDDIIDQFDYFFLLPRIENSL
ncbi:type IV pilus modification protein PilV [Vreelandella neptunia]|jgi:type IV pilus assembly protein PilV|uniref:Type IV pilus modification protein PilV n=1 Tax=Vreelandella neptunia TaxID=115551 RepID=A0ABZ0YK29_9GAMM|nr:MULTISPECIES: type IV pilus modification protein PilV [Halomonas]MBL1269238.1 type IV pilus modification protein PilV [Halomonas sp.]MDN3560915.1 type IV pilus modification protein PilV [Halomonas neptunia]TDV91116.1 type IV pilus assembly protein PilV [Halomonas alkaliantarctica]WQH11899.1 type IV pilus modification protein PilV [Halomonas neptunia]